MISCTSGQIDMVWKYLLAREGKLKAKYGVSNLVDLAPIYAEVSEIRPRPAFPEILFDAPALATKSMQHLSDFESFVASRAGYFINATLNNMPSRTLAPSVRGDVLEEICRDFNSEQDIGIAFNSYDPTESIETVYLNPRAEELLQRRVKQDSSFRKTQRHTTHYDWITEDGLLNALWLYEYDLRQRRSIDGAYFRMVMLGELSRAETIYVARPIQCCWTDEMPLTFGEKEDLKTEVFFNAAYLGERFRIELVNRLLRQGAIDPRYADEQGYHPVKIVEVEPKTPQRFADYFSESIEMFEDAYQRTKEIFRLVHGKET
jgi:hypothetical protein